MDTLRTERKLLVNAFRIVGCSFLNHTFSASTLQHARYSHGLLLVGNVPFPLACQGIQKIFPPLVSSITVILIGVALTGTGMKYWGGGVVCADMIWKQHCK